MFYSYLKHPYYEVVRQFKTHKKTVEKEASNVMKDLIEARNRKFDSRREAADYFRGLKERLAALKEQLNEFHAQEEKLLDLLGKRIARMAEFEEIDPQVETVESSKQIDRFLQALIQDYFNRADPEAPESEQERAVLGRYLSAAEEDTLEAQAFRENRRVLRDLELKRVQSALDWCAVHRSKLSKVAVPFEFRLRQIQFVELLVAEGSPAALRYLHENLKEVEPQHLGDLRKMMRALVFGKRVREMREFAQYFSEDYWTALRESFKEVQFLVQGLTQQPFLETLVAAGITALKTPFCESGSKAGFDCPVCSEDVFPLAKSLPYTAKTSSNLICRILGTVMDENNPPVVLPNRQVFSQKGVEKIARAVEGSAELQVACPVTGKEFPLSQVAKMYLTS